jgi:transcriptional regulator with XRE-family HTH domain
MKLSEAVARNVAAERARQKMEQKKLAEGMSVLGHAWTQRTVAEVEQERRRVSFDELLGLALVLHRTIPELLRPSEPLDTGADRYPLSPEHSELLARGRLRVWIDWQNDRLGMSPVTDPEEVMRQLGGES